MTEEDKKPDDPVRKRKRLVNGDVLPDGTVFIAKDPAQRLKENPRHKRIEGRPPGGAKKRHRKILLAYLSNADNKIITKRQDYLKLLGLKGNTCGYLGKIFTKDELTAIEVEGLANRRKAYAPRIAMVDDGLLFKAAEGSAPEAKLVYQRFEGWKEKTEVTHDLPITVIVKRFDGEIVQPELEKIAEAEFEDES